LLGDFTVTHNTTIIRAIADTLGATRVEICAFAGKAAARLRERTGHNARTIHSMLEYKGDTLGFRRSDLNGKTVILDEASMVNSELLAEITKRTPARLVLVGDEAQLPPVGSGAPFHDLIRLMPEVVNTLKTCYRNSEAIYKAAMCVRNSRMPALKEQTESEFWQFAQTGNDVATHKQILQLVREKKIDFATDLVLACRNGDGLNLRSAVDSLNVDIKAIVNPPRADDSRPPLRQLDECDRVICTQNDPETDTWNGTTGTVARLDLSGGAYIELDFPTSEGQHEVYIEKGKLKNWSLAYALTVHKSQGSQYRRVFFVCLMRDTFMLLDRSMLYTAMTRAQEACYGLGQLQAFKVAINKADVKLTVIQELLG
jgi:exodeoxyribonuclease V alpha subunit